MFERKTVSDRGARRTVASTRGCPGCRVVPGRSRGNPRKRRGERVLATPRIRTRARFWRRRRRRARGARVDDAASYLVVRGKSNCAAKDYISPFRASVTRAGRVGALLPSTARLRMHGGRGGDDQRRARDRIARRASRARAENEETGNQSANYLRGKTIADAASRVTHPSCARASARPRNRTCDRPHFSAVPSASGLP